VEAPIEVEQDRRHGYSLKVLRTFRDDEADALPEWWLRTDCRMAVMVEGEFIRVTRSVAIPRSEIDLRFSRSSGPGGQHAQRTETRVDARFDVEASSALTETQKRRVVARAGPVLRAIAQDERSQSRNRELAIDRLVEQLREALRVKRKRRPTKPTRESRERRLEGKRRRSETKRRRRPPAEEA
jgi:ribosome-associated protein